eukprot:TRINITY_DN13874_c0_g1_i1.p1 TRINITY_DN13874_c0_g1~~TRINITY_DN13874_c0_g1_i1.p1  ORF type:complete len:723 (-),score=246.21 TRINITY_DN13874_c0_g1_i1:222-2390(-)
MLRILSRSKNSLDFKHFNIVKNSVFYFSNSSFSNGKKGGLENFGELSFNDKTMSEYLAPNTFKNFKNAQLNKKPPSEEVINQIANAVSKWAGEKGVTHFTHCFQPLSGTFGEKHDAWINPTKDGQIKIEFKGKQLTSAEPDASSFPNGGLRQTHEARGNVIWDPSSPIHISNYGPNKSVSTLRIPSIFVGWNGNALDHKTPLLRSEYYLEKSLLNLMKAVGDNTHNIVHAESGVEQEFFLVDANTAKNRPDLLSIGRMLIGKQPLRGQDHLDQYYSAMSGRIIECIGDMERELWKLGIPSTTRHSEVSPAQYEIAPFFQSANTAADNNMLSMLTMKEVAKDHDLMLLLHEKPFKGLNGSGKHNNWSFGTDQIGSFLEPKNKHFLLALTAFIRACDIHGDLLRNSVATAGNDHRLGAQEAPPGIMSIYLGEDIAAMVQKARDGVSNIKVQNISSPQDFAVPHLPQFYRQSTDRNRTSPIAFTGNKFEFRAVGSSQNPSYSSLVLNTITAESLQYLADQITDQKGNIEKVLQDTLNKHSRVLFDGNNYSDDWVVEAESRGLLNLRDTVDSLEHLVSDKNIQLFEKSNILTANELKSRSAVFYENFNLDIEVEVRTLLDLVNIHVIPAAAKYLDLLNRTSEATSFRQNAVKDHLSSLITYITNLRALRGKFEDLDDKVAKAKLIQTEIRPHMDLVRTESDNLESLVAKSLWTLPSYSDLFFDGFH